MKACTSAFSLSAVQLHCLSEEWTFPMVLLLKVDRICFCLARDRLWEGTLCLPFSSALPQYIHFQAVSIIQLQIVTALLLAVHISTVPENSNTEINWLAVFISSKNLVDHLLPHAYPFPVLEVSFSLESHYNWFSTETMWQT